MADFPDIARLKQIAKEGEPSTPSVARLKAIAKGTKKKGTLFKPDSPAEDFTSGALRGAKNTLELLGGVGEFALDPIGVGMDAIAKFQNKDRVPLRGENIAGKVFKKASQAAGTQLRKTGLDLNVDPTFAGNIGNSVGSALPVAPLGVIASKAPVARTLLAEGIAAAGGGSGRTIAQQSGVGQTGQDVAEVVGGIGAQSLAGLGRIIRRGVSEVTPFGRKRRVARVLQGTVLDKDKAIQNLDRPVPIRANFTSGQRSGDLGLLSAERALIQTKGGRGVQFMADINDEIVKEAEKLKGGDPAKFISRVTKEVDNAIKSVDDNARLAINNAKDEIDSLPKGLSNAQAGRIAKAHLDDSLSTAKKAESAAWEALPNQPIPAERTNSLKQKLSSFLNLEQGQSIDDVPGDLIAEILDEDTLTTEGLKNFRSRALEEVRSIPFGQQATKVRNLEKLQSELIDTMNADPKFAKAYDKARDLTKTINDTYFNSAVGKVIARSGHSDLIDPDLTFRQLIKKGEEGGVSAKQLLRASRNPDLVDATETYLSNMFKTIASPDGKIDPGRAKRFVSNYKETLERFPSLRAQLNKAIKAGVVADAAETQAQLSRKDITRSAANLFLDNEPEVAVRRIFANENSSRAMDSLLSSVGKDAEAKEGLQRIVFNHFMDKLKLASKSADGGIVLSDTKPSTFLNTHRKALTKLYGDKIQFLENAAKASDLKNKTSSASLKFGSDTFQNSVGGLFGRFIGAGIGAKLGLGSGSIQTAAVGSRVVKDAIGGLGAKKARALLEEAFFNPELMKELLSKNIDDTVTPLLKGHLLTVINEDEQ